MWTALATIVLATAAPDLHLIPTPQSVVRQVGEFPLERHAYLQVVNKEDAFTAEQLIEESPTSFGWGKSSRNPLRVTIAVVGADAAVDSRLKKLGLSLPKDANSDSYILSVRPTQIICAGKSATGTFYAVQTLKQLIRANKSGKGIGCVDVVDWPALQIRGWQDDISRGPIPTLDFLKKEVREMSEYKLNAFTLYTEHVFKLKKHPTIAPADGITAEQVKELDNYCRKYHVQLIGNFQSFGHFAHILEVPGYENLKETNDVITPAKEESYKFLKDVYSEIAPSYSSKLFNINCDETYGLGEGPAKEMVARDGLGNVYAKHINRVASLLKDEGKTVMMWGDIALQYPDIRKNLPKDLIVLTWGYDPRASFVDQIVPFTKIGFKFLVCPGVSCWGQIFPDLKSATVNISNFVRDGAKNGALGMLNTTWDDTGENLFNNNWYPLVWGAEVSWKPAQSIDDVRVPFKDGINGNADNVTTVESDRLRVFDDAFPMLFYGLKDGSLSRAMWKLSDMREKPISNGMSDGAFWRLPWDLDAGQAKNAKNKGFAQDAMDVMMAVQHARASATRNANSLDAMEFSVSKMAYLSMQTQTVAEFPDLLKVPANVRGQAAEQKASALATQIGSLEDKYKKVWRLECRPWWLDRNVAKYERMKANLAGLSTIPLFNPKSGSLDGPTQIEIGAMAEGSEIHYTLDGSEPTKTSPKYEAPIALQHSAFLKAANFFGGKKSPTMSGVYTMMSRPAKVETVWNHYGDNKAELAFDGMDSTYFWSYGQVAAGSTFTVILDNPDMIGGIKVTTGHPDHPEDYLKEGVLEVSTDGEKWREMAKFEKGTAECGLIGFRVKAIRIRVTKDNGNWLVIREISLK